MSLNAFLFQAVNGLSTASGLFLVAAGLSLIFGIMRLVNLAHGDLILLAAYLVLSATTALGLPLVTASLLVVAAMFVLGFVLQRLVLERVLGDDILPPLLVTFGLALTLEGLFRWQFGASGQPYAPPPALTGGVNLGFMFLPKYRAWVVLASLVICIASWLLIEKTKLGAYLRAATENPALVQAFGVNVPVMVMLTYAAGAGLAAMAGVLVIRELDARQAADLAPLAADVDRLGAALGAAVAMRGQPTALRAQYR